MTETTNQHVDYLAEYARLRIEHQRIEGEMRRLQGMARAQAAQEIAAIMRETGLTLDRILPTPRPHKEGRAPYGSKTRHGKPVDPVTATV